LTAALPSNKPPEKVDNWPYSEKDDTIHNAKVKFERVTSFNTLNFNFPYGGSQHRYLVIRKSYDGSKDRCSQLKKVSL